MKVFENNGKMFAVYYEDEEDMDMLRYENGELFTAKVGLFDGAKFGDKFKTREGLKALYLYKGRDCNDEKDDHKLIIIGDDWSNDYNEDGRLWSSEHRELDIVSRWED